MKRAAVLLALLAAGCAAQEKSEPRAPSQGAQGYGPSPTGYPSTATTPLPSVQTNQPDAAPSSMNVPVQPGTFAPAPEVRQAQDDLERGRRELETAGGQCKDACRALSSMDRAAGKICGLETGDRCGGAKDKLYSARDRVRLSCGTCGDGTSTDRNAPVPSR